MHGVEMGFLKIPELHIAEMSKQHGMASRFLKRLRSGVNSSVCIRIEYGVRR